MQSNGSFATKAREPSASTGSIDAKRAEVTMSMPCIELAEFRLLPGVGDDALTAALRDLDAFLAQQQGFIRRRTLRDGDQCADLVEWRDRACANSAAEAVMQSPVAARYFALLDLDSARMRHFDVIA